MKLQLKGREVYYEGVSVGRIEDSFDKKNLYIPYDDTYDRELPAFLKTASKKSTLKNIKEFLVREGRRS